MKSKTFLKISGALVMALLMLVLTPMQIFAANFNVSRNLLKNNSWWTPDIGVRYVAGTTNASCAYYHYYPEMTGVYDFIVFGNTKTPMSGAVYKKSSNWYFWTPIQMDYADSSSRNSGITMTLALQKKNEYWFALGGQPNCSGTYYFTVKPHRDFDVACRRNFQYHGKIWTRTTWTSYLDDNQKRIDKVIYLSPYDLNVLYSYLTSDLIERVSYYYSDGMDLYDAICRALNFIGFYVGLVDGIEIYATIYSIICSFVCDLVDLNRGGAAIDAIVELMDELKAKGNIEYYWYNGNYCHNFNNWLKITYYTTYPGFENNGEGYCGGLEEGYDVEIIDSLLFYGPEYYDGKFENWDYEYAEKILNSK